MGRDPPSVRSRHGRDRDRDRELDRELDRDRGAAVARAGCRARSPRCHAGPGIGRYRCNSEGQRTGRVVAYLAMSVRYFRRDPTRPKHAAARSGARAAVDRPDRVPAHGLQHG